MVKESERYDFLKVIPFYLRFGIGIQTQLVEKVRVPNLNSQNTLWRNNFFVILLPLTQFVNVTKKTATKDSNLASRSNTQQFFVFYDTIYDLFIPNLIKMSLQQKFKTKFKVCIPLGFYWINSLLLYFQWNILWSENGP